MRGRAAVLLTSSRDYSAFAGNSWASCSSPRPTCEPTNSQVRAVEVGFEPTDELPHHTLSRTAQHRPPGVHNVRHVLIKPASGRWRTVPDKCVPVGLADHAGPGGAGAFPSVRTLIRCAGLSERTVRTCLDRLEHGGLIRPCDPAVVAAKIKRADRRPTGSPPRQPRARPPA